ncbi:MAG: hypothetical protein Q9226_004769 [Calogaya cf. arnoldii]
MMQSLLTLLLAASSLAAADPIRRKRQDAAASCTDALCVFSEFLATATTASSLLPQVTPPPNPGENSGGGGANVVHVSVAQPSLCSESALQFSSSWSVPTGTVQIMKDPAQDAGWGDAGSTWNISASGGVKLENFRVPCQGSICKPGVNQESDGKITQLPDGSWTFEVTPDYQPSSMIFGEASGGSGKYDLTITSTPECAKPVFQNCSERSFDPTADQWEAYSTSDFLTKYLAENNIKSLSDLLAKATNDFLPTIDAQGMIWQIYACEYPSSGQCESDDPNAVAGFLVVAAVVRMSQMLSLIYNTVELAKGDMGAYITQIVVKFFQPQAEQEWTSIVSAVSSLIGLFVALAIIIDTATLGSATGFLVAAIVGIQGAIGAASTFKTGFSKEKPDATYLTIEGNYSQSVVDYSRGLQEIINNVWANEELTSGGIIEGLSNGAWLEVGNPYNVTGITEEARDWLDNLLVTSYINRVFNDADAFIVFLPYMKYMYYGVSGRTEVMDFTQQECEKRWAGNPSWKYYATCDIKLGGNGEAGMAVVTRPSSQGGGSKTWTSDVEWVWASYTWDPHAFVESTLTGFGEHGFGYNLTNIDFDSILDRGSQAAIDNWKALPLSTPGLFNIPVCRLTNMMDLPGGGTPATDMGKDAVFRPDPLSCVGSNSTATGAKFCDNVSPEIKKAIGCP